MILYFDTLITDKPFIKRGNHGRSKSIRDNCPAYKTPKRVDIAKYTLASYAQYPWSNVLIKYELEDHKDYGEFDKYVLKLFPKAIILHKRSDSQKDYQESLRILDRMKDNWVFYTPNNDQPLITSEKNLADYFTDLLNKAQKYKGEYKYVSIIYSHFSEYLNMSIKRKPENIVCGSDTKIIEEDDLAIYYLKKNGEFNAIQIVERELLNKWFNSRGLGSKRIIRPEDVKKDIRLNNHLLIIPKKQLCAHFDGYEHMRGYPNEISADIVPPLFIPNGFFTNNIRIAYGYEKYRQGWVNINPKAKEYSFRDKKNGTDLKISLDEIPLFWKSHIKKIDINKNANLDELKEFAQKNYKKILNPWTSTSLTFKIRLVIFKIIVRLGLVENFKQVLIFLKKI